MRHAASGRRLDPRARSLVSAYADGGQARLRAFDVLVLRTAARADRADDLAVAHDRDRTAEERDPRRELADRDLVLRLDARRERGGRVLKLERGVRLRD